MRKQRAGKACSRQEQRLALVNKITWQKAGHVTEPGRYMFTFGYLTVTTEDLAIWKQFPGAAFTLVEMPRPATESPADAPAEEFHLGAFELPPSS
jgi:hypothetical protein